MSNGKIWTASDTAEMAVLTGRGWSDARIGRKLGFATDTVQRRRTMLGIQANYCRRCEIWELPPASLAAIRRAARVAA